MNNRHSIMFTIVTRNRPFFLLLRLEKGRPGLQVLDKYRHLQQISKAFTQTKIRPPKTYCLFLLKILKLCFSRLFVPSTYSVSYLTSHFSTLCTMLQKLSKCGVKAWLLKFGDFAATQILCQIQLLRIQTVQECHFWQS